MISQLCRIIYYAMRNIMFHIRRCFICVCSPYWRIHEGCFCPCCGKYVKKMKESEYVKKTNEVCRSRYVGIEQDIICPFCNSLPRHRIQVSWLTEELSKLKGKKILYFSIEKGVKNWLDKNNISYTTADLFLPADLQIDIQDTGLPDESFDYIFCNHVLEHVDNFSRAFKEIYRILNANGILVCSFPIDENLSDTYEDEMLTTDQERIRAFGHCEHKRIFGSNAVDVIEKFGYSVEIYYGKNLPERIRPVVGPADYDQNYFFICCKK